MYIHINMYCENLYVFKLILLFNFSVVHCVVSIQFVAMFTAAIKIVATLNVKIKLNQIQLNNAKGNQTAIKGTGLKDPGVR